MGAARGSSNRVALARPPSVVIELMRRGSSNRVALVRPPFAPWRLCERIPPEPPADRTDARGAHPATFSPLRSPASLRLCVK